MFSFPFPRKHLPTKYRSKYRDIKSKGLKCNIKRGKLFGGTVLPNNTLFGGTVPPNNTLFGGTVPPNSTLFGGTPDFDKEHIFSSINELFLTLRNQQSRFFFKENFLVI